MSCGPTLGIGDEIFTDTIRIANRDDLFDGADLSGAHGKG